MALVRFAARSSGLAFGLAPAVRPAGLPEAPRARAARRSFLRCGERIFGCPCGWRGRPGQCAAFRPRRCDFLPATVRLALACGLVVACGRGIGPIRRVPHAAGHRGRRARQLGTPGGLPPIGRDESCRTAYGVPPGPDPGRLRRATLAAPPPRLAAPASRAPRPGRQARRAAGAPLKIVKKILTARPPWTCPTRTDR